MFREAGFQAQGDSTLIARANRFFGDFWAIPRRLKQLTLLLSITTFLLAIPATSKAQVTATLSGTVEDQSGGVIPAAQVTLTDEVTKQSRVEQSNGAGLYAFPSLTPGTYDIKASAKGFKATEITGIVLNAGDVKTVPALNLTVGAESQTVTVSADSEMIPVENGQRVEVLTSADINNLALAGRDTSELLKVLPGTSTQSMGLTATAPAFNDLNITVDEGALGNGYAINGAVNRGGQGTLEDGAQMIDIGNMAGSLTIVDPEMTAEVSVQASNLGADQAFGPVVVSAISRSGSANYHGDAYFNARNNVLNANGWQQKNNHTALGPQHYYYPGGSFGGPVPGTHKKLLFWGGYERWLQNQGNQNVLQSYIPTPEMMQGDFSIDNPDNTTLCPQGFFQGKPPGGYPGGSWCSDLGGTVLANGTTTASLPTPAATGTYTSGSSTYTTDAGQKFPAGFLDPGAAALAKIWPKANANPANIPGGYNYYQPIVNVDNGWIWRVRVDYLLGDNTKIYGSYQQAYSSGFAQGNGAHLYWTPGNSIPFPGGGEVENNYGKTLAGHIVHNFNASTTNDFMAAWAFGSYPFTTPNPAAAERTTLGYSYGKVFSTPSANIPAYNSAGSESFPDFSQASIFENPVGKYAVKKEAPQFNDTLTKVWGTHTIKIGAFTQTTDNFQSSFSYFEDGLMSFNAGQHPDLVNPSNGIIGSPQNSVAQFVNGLVNGYQENNGAPIGDVAQLSTAAFVDDTWKATRRLTAELGIRIEHVGHWYDRDHLGLAVFYPGRVLQDYYAGKYAPGYYWHAIDAGVPLSGQPNRFAYPDARFGMSYDVFGHGNTVVRGGWGVYRFVTQVNTIANGATPANTSKDVLGYGQPGSTELQLQNIHNVAYVNCPSATKPPPCGVQGGQFGLDPTDYGQPMTQAYNLTIDQRLPWNSQFEIAYVGSSTSQLVDAGEDIEGSNFNEIANQNKTPIGALFLPDPMTGTISTNPENVTENPTGTGETPTGNVLADYHPLGAVYGTNSTYMIQNTDYGNYNGLQASWTKTTGRLTFNLNGTWSKNLATSLQENPYVVARNYGPTATDRPLVFNASYTYSSGTLHSGSALMNELGGGWTITGISTWQKGGYIPAALGNGVPNFGMGLQYTGLPATAKAEGISTSIGDPTYFGTDENFPIEPVLTCNPTSGLATHQVLNGKCFSAPAVGRQGGQAYPYMSMTPYFDNDLALYRTFNLHEKQQVQLRVSAFDWLNHSLLAFANGNYYTINYNVDYASKAITPNFNQSSSGANAFGVMTVRSALPYARVIELDVKYSF
ncbi:MAG TPA: carboxypeptidase-like regulatory domain-containing protein [Terracidiphilus sp.]|nr:carboxypeptidase-like regulatory domain-containing protein [Terracidiphilus sp.]